MNIPLTPVALNFARNRLVRIAQPQHVQLSACRGALWVTIDGDRQDIVVESGQTFEFSSNTPAVVSALGSDVVATARRLRCPPPRRFLQRLIPDFQV